MGNVISDFLIKVLCASGRVGNVEDSFLEQIAL
jgi:hypothetical protein